jgi:hypothetical protein
MALSDVERSITSIVVERFLNLNQPTPKKHLVLKFKPHGTEAVHRLVRYNVLRQLHSEELIPNAIAFHYCGDPAALSFAKSSVEVVIPVLQHLYEITNESVMLTTAAVEGQMNNVNPKAVKLGLFLSQEMGFFGGLEWNSNLTGVQAVRINENVINVDAGKAWDNHIRQYITDIEQTYRRDARARFHQGIFDLVEGRADRSVTPMQRHELATRLEIGKDDHDAIVRELMAEEIIKQKPASERYRGTSERFCTVQFSGA